MRVAIACVVLSLAALAYSQLPRPCVAPILWSGKAFQRDRDRRFQDNGRIFYDASNQRIAYIVEVETAEGTDVIYGLTLYKEGLRYRDDRNSKVCTVEKTEDSFRPIQIPLNATSLGEFYLGVSGVDGVLVEQWIGNSTDPAGEYSILVTQKTCAPVNEFFYDIERNDVFETFFYDVVLGITEPDVFIPPSNCPPPPS